MAHAVKLAVRSLGHFPGFALLAIAMIGLGIGSTTAMFSVTHTVLLKALAYREPERLATVSFRVPQFSKELSTVPVNAQHYLLFRDHSRTLEELGLVRPDSHILSGMGEAEHVNGALITVNFFHLLGVQPILGRSFSDGEDQPGHNRLLIVSYQFWQQRLSGRRDVLGRKILLDGQSYEIIGVMPPAFPFPRGRQLSELEKLPERIDYWAPIVFSRDDLATPVGNENYLAIGRLKAGAMMPQVAADLTALETSFAKTYPEPVQFIIVVRSLQEAMAREVRLPLLILMAAVVAVLLIVCINLMNLMMVRSIAQRRDWAIRLAMGAKVRDLLRGAFIESLLLSLAGGTAGSLLAWVLLRLVRLKAPIDLPRIDELSLDSAALLFALSASVATAILFGIWPAWRASRINPQEALQSSGRTASESRQGHHSGNILVAAEVTLSTVLLLSAGLLLRSFVTILGVDPGLNIQHLLAVRINLPPEKYHRDSDVSSFYSRLLDEVKGLPGVEGAGLVSDLPLTGENNTNPATAADRPIPPVTQWPMTNWRYASSEYFKTAGIAFKDGRLFTKREGDTREVVISDNLAARLWPGQSAVGRPLKIYGNRRLQTVVGVVGAIHATSLTDDPTMMIYFPNWNHFARDMALFVRSEKETQGLASAVRSIVAGLDSQAAIPSIQTMKQVAARSLAPRRFQLVLLISFAVVALSLACMGIYGVLAFATSRRTSEIGIRMALGARPAQILESILLNGMVPVLIGIVAAMCVSVAFSKILQALLFQVRALDPEIYVAASAAMLIVAALACFVPARRAASLNPIEALRHE